jgi:NitT/TauT family transport system permease protein
MGDVSPGTTAVNKGGAGRARVTTAMRDSLRWALRMGIVLAVLIGLWHLAVEISGVHPVILPPPTLVAETLISRIPLFASSMWSTIQTLIYGFLIGSLGGALAAFVVYYSKRARWALYPYLVALFVIPKAVYIPLLILWIGAGRSYQVIIAALFAFFPLTDNTLKGLQGVDRDLIDMGRLLEASEWTIFTRLQLPAISPYMVAGMKVGLSEAFVGAVLAELLVPATGIGARIMEAVGPSNTEFILAGILVIAVVGIITYLGMEMIERRMLFWHYE